ncbi:MAG: 16S rRNA (guanine(527)-N(7))-methyltransferase RsmG [Spirochaetales bacterium]
MTSEERALLEEGLSGLLSAAQIGLVARYCDELALWNPRLRLVDASGRDLIVRHVFDCMSALPALRESLSAQEPGDSAPVLADLGSGAGLPGILFAIAVPELRVWLVERRGRRCGFLRNCRAILGLSNTEVREQPSESLPDESCTVISARAYAALTPELLALIHRILKPGGEALLLKGQRSRVNEELAAASTAAQWADVAVRTDALSVPYLDSERNLVRIRRLPN